MLDEIWMRNWHEARPRLDQDMADGMTALSKLRVRLFRNRTTAATPASVSAHDPKSQTPG